MEQKVIKRAKRGQKKSWELFIRSNLRYVVSVANRYKGCGVTMADLIHEGNIGLIEAAKRFDPERGVRFITYAVWWIRQAMVHAIASQGGAVHLSVKQAQKRLKVREMIREMEQASGEEPSLEALAKAMDELPEEVVMLKAAREALSLDAPLGDADSINHVDLLTDGNDNQAEDRLNRSAISNQLLTALATLPKREGEILRMRYGFAGEPMTLQEIGEQMNLSRERIRQLEKQALRRLRGQGRMAMLKDILN
jgi:RNA polymerase primary sigma factor